MIVLARSVKKQMYLNHSKEVVQMKTRKLVVAMVMAITALSIGAQAFAADQLKTRTQIKIKDGSCK